MSNEARYFEVLSGAVAQIEEDSFEARGGIYDRLWAIVVERLQAEGDDTDAVLARERAAFLAAVKRIEFGERQATSPEQGAVTALETPVPVLETPAPVPETPAPMLEAPAPALGMPSPLLERRQRRPLSRRIAFRMLAACAVLLAIWLAYVVIMVRSDSASAERWAGDGAANSWHAQIMRAALSLGNLLERRSTVEPAVSQRAVLYEESAATATGTTFSGHAVWRHQRADSVVSSGAIVSIDVDIPQKSLALRMSLKRAPDGGVISHFVEFRFLNADRSASDAVEDVLGVLMKNDELSRGIELAGKVVRVQRGMFLMGLSGAQADLGRNLKLLKERPWLDIPLVMKDKSRNILAIEKGATGESALNQALDAWGQT